MNSVLQFGNQPPSCPPSSISVLRPGGWNLRTAPSSVLGSGNLAPSCPPSSISVLRPGGRSLRTELSISVLRPGGRNPAMVKFRLPSWRTEFQESQNIQDGARIRQDGIYSVLRFRPGGRDAAVTPPLIDSSVVGTVSSRRITRSQVFLELTVFLRK